MTHFVPWLNYPTTKVTFYKNFFRASMFIFNIVLFVQFQGMLIYIFITISKVHWSLLISLSMKLYFFSPVVLSTRWKTIVWLDRQVVFCYHWKQFWVLISISDVVFGHFVLKLNYPTSKITFCSTFRNRCVYIKYFAVHTISGGSCIYHYSNIT